MAKEYFMDDTLVATFFFSFFLLLLPLLLCFVKRISWIIIHVGSDAVRFFFSSAWIRFVAICTLYRVASSHRFDSIVWMWLYALCKSFFVAENLRHSKWRNEYYVIRFGSAHDLGIWLRWWAHKNSNRQECSTMRDFYTIRKGHECEDIASV